MADPISCRSFSTLTAGLALGSATTVAAADERPKPGAAEAAGHPTEAPLATSIKKLELKPNPFLKKPSSPAAQPSK